MRTALRRGGIRLTAALALVGLAGTWPLLAQGTATDRSAVAIIVNADNQAPDPSLDDVRAMFLLERQFWANGHRVALFLPPPGSAAKDVVLDRLYGMTDFELRKYLVEKLFRGVIPSIPSTLPNVAAVLSAVRSSEGGMAAVLATEVPAGVRVLRIDGKTPNAPGYPLFVTHVP